MGVCTSKQRETKKELNEIIIVDDERIHLRMNSKIIKEIYKKTPITVNDPQKAIDLIKTLNPALVVTDWDMGRELSGRDVIHECESKGIKYIVVSSNKDVLEELRTNKKPIIEKPQRFEDFSEIIDQYLL